MKWSCLTRRLEKDQQQSHVGQSGFPSDRKRTSQPGAIEAGGFWIRSGWLYLLSALGSFVQLLSQMHWICAFCLTRWCLIPHFHVRLGQAWWNRRGWGWCWLRRAASPSPFPLALPPLFSVPHFPPGARGLMLPRDLLCHGGSGGNQQCFWKCAHSEACA